jgi:hypothetical protein
MIRALRVAGATPVMKNLQPYTLVLCVIVGGLVFVALGLHSRLRRQEMEQRGVSFPGTILEAKVDRRGDANDTKRYLLRVSWNEGGAAPLEKYFEVQREYFELHTQVAAGEPPPPVTVRAIPGRPDRATLAGTSSDFYGMDWLGYLLVAAGAFGCWRIARRISAVRSGSAP